MEKIIIKKGKTTSELKKEKQQTPEPKRLSAFGEWRRNNPKGAYKVNDYSIFDC